jgi:hypothetical protein
MNAIAEPRMVAARIQPVPAPPATVACLFFKLS